MIIGFFLHTFYTLYRKKANDFINMLLKNRIRLKIERETELKVEHISNLDAKKEAKKMKNYSAGIMTEQISCVILGIR